ncbi:MAG: dipeptidase PepE [Ferruginibacter sp.]
MAIKSNKKVLALSSSRVGSSGFLEEALSPINNFLGKTALRIAFIPFASVQKDDDEYGSMVTEALQSLPHFVEIVTAKNAKPTIEAADAIMTGGGNTFKLLHDIYKLDLKEIIQHKVNSGTPYIGWSAGSNITGLSISTSNDMPIIEPQSFKALSFFPFQINPHYFNQPIQGHNGETRDQRLSEFIVLNPGIPVVGLPEGTGLLLENNKLTLTGRHNAVLFINKNAEVQRREISAADDLGFLLEN